jgi:hypothetical protein
MKSVSNINFDYRRPERLRNSVLAELLLKIQRKINCVYLDSGEDAKDADHFIDHKDLLRLIVV